MSRIAYLGLDHQLHLISPAGGRGQQLSFAKVPGPLMNWGATAGRDACSWPCWSPDGRWIACFQSLSGEEAGGPAVVSALEVDGVEERQLVELRGELPLYASWSPDGKRLAALCQREDELQLSVCDLDQIGRSRIIDQGVPLFYCWMPDSRDLLLHMGNRRERAGRLVVRAGTERGEDRILPHPPGSFCAPFALGPDLLFVVSRGPTSHVVLTDQAGEALREVAALDGLVAVLPTADPDWILASSAPRGEGSLYQGVHRIWLSEAELEQLVEEDNLAFFSDRQQNKLIYAVRDSARGCMWWKVLNLRSGAHRSVAPFWPTREQKFYLHFFEQYVVSHPALSPDGRYLCWASHPDPRHSEGREPQIWVADLEHPEERPRAVAEGSFAVFSPTLVP